MFILTCPSFSDTRLMGIKDSGSVAWPASSRNTWVKCPTLRKNKTTVGKLSYRKRDRRTKAVHSKFPNHIKPKPWLLLQSHILEHPSTGAGADHNPVEASMTDVFSCPRVQSQHFWYGLRKNSHINMAWTFR